MENESGLVKVGKFIDQTTYKEEKHNFMIEDIANIDYLKNNTVHEVKKSESQLDAAIWQVKFYLYHLHLRGVKDIKGKIDLPLQKKTETVELEEGDVEIIAGKIEEIEKIINSEFPPHIEPLKVCRACAYYDLCMIYFYLGGQYAREFLYIFKW
jgi:CRISPR-associated exonuclease Cas4